MHASRNCFTEFNQKLKRYQLLLNSIATADMNYNQLDVFLKSQMQKREVGIYCYIISIWLLHREHYQPLKQLLSLSFGRRKNQRFGVLI